MPSSASAATPAIYTLSLHDALPICDTSAAVLANAHLAMARLCRWSGEIANAASHVAEVLRLVDPKSASSVHQVSLALGIQAAAMNIAGDAARADACMARAMTIVQQPSDRCELLYEAYSIARNRRRPDEARDALEALRIIAANTGATRH